jgi:uncharacterized membrane protein HdeD (DUF308 family)
MTTRFNGTLGSALTRDWWLVLLRGIVAILFGLMAFIWPGITLIVLVFLFGIYAIVDGLLSFAEAFSAGKRGQSWIWPVIVGIVGIAAGILAFAWPHLTALVLLYIIAIWAIVTGVAEFIAGIMLRHEISNEWLLMLGGVISVLFGVLVFARPGAGALAIVWLIGFYAIVLGVERIGLAFRLRDWQEHPLPGGMSGMSHAA